MTPFRPPSLLPALIGAFLLAFTGLASPALAGDEPPPAGGDEDGEEPEAPPPPAPGTPPPPATPDGVPAKDAPAAPVLAPPPPALPPVDESSFFDEPPAAPDPEAEKLNERLARGRKQRELHQGFAFATLGTLIAAEVVGTANLIQRNQGTGAVPDEALVTHRVLASAGTGLYLTTGTLVWTAPKGLKARGSEDASGGTGKKKKADSSKIHRTLSVLHGIGMGTQLVTGFLMGNVAGGKDYQALSVAHMVSGYTTIGLVATAAIVISFY